MVDVELYQECKLLSAILFNNQVMNDCCDIKPEYFSNDGYSELFSFYRECFNNGIEINPTRIIKKFGDEVKQFLSDLIGITYSKIELKQIIKSLKTDGQQRYALKEIKKIVELAEKEPYFNVYEALSKIDTYELDEEKDYKTSALERLDWRMKNKGTLSGIACGIEEFDEVINGFNKGCLYICAGRSSMGKSAFMTSAVSEIERTTGVGIISLEMTGEELYNRIISVRTRTPYWVIDRGKATDKQFDRYAEGLSKISRLQICDKGGLSCYQVCSKIRKMVKSGAKIVFVDHLGLITVEEKGNLAHNIGKITSSLKSLSKELEIPIVILCQVNRVAENQEDKRPQLKDLRDSGRIEEDADCVFFLYRDEYYNPIKTADDKLNRYEKAEILVEKNRNGACKNIKCQFDNQLMRFY